MSAPWPESTGLAGSALGPRRQALTIWLRQAAGIYRAAMRSRLRPPALAGRLTWIFAAQAVLAGVSAYAVLSAGAQAGLDRVPLVAGWIVTVVAVVLLLVHALSRLGAVSGDVLRDVDAGVLESYEATPLASSAYVAGRTAFHLVEQGQGLAALLPSFALAHAMRAFDLGDLVALALALLAVSLTYCVSTVGRVLRGHARRVRGAPLPASMRPTAGAVFAQALIGGALAAAGFGILRQGVDGIGPVLLALALTPAAPIVGAAFDGVSLDLFGRPFGLWLPTSLWLACLLPLAWCQARLRWKAPVLASGWDLRAAFVLAWLAPALALAATLRGGVGQAALTMLLVAGAGALVPPAWAAGHELGDLGRRPGVRPLGILSARRTTAAWWALALQALLLLVLVLVVPAPTGRLPLLQLALVCWAATAPTIVVVASATRWIGLRRGSATAFFTMIGIIVALVVAALPQLLGIAHGVPVMDRLARAIDGPAQLLASSSPVLILPEAAHDLLGPPLVETWLELPPAWRLGMPDWLAGILVQAAIALPLAWLLARAAKRAGR